MIIKYRLVRLFINFLLVILFPLIQKQWLNLYLFDINNFTIYKLLYYLSGLICPSLVIINSLNRFTYYKFNNKKINHKFDISGRLLFFIVFTVLLILSIIISSYFIINLRLFFNIFFSDNKFLINFDINKQILFVVIISILLLFKNIKLFIKKIIFINYLIISIIIWYSDINNLVLNDGFLINILKFENLNFINLLFLLSIEIFYYLWSYISNSTYLSDWSVPRFNKSDAASILNIIFFYLLIFIYYSLLF